MKKYIKIILSSVLALLVLSCNRELDTFNEDPTVPSSVPPNILLAQIEVASFAVHTSGLARLSNMFTQHLAGASDQYVSYANYNIPETATQNEWDAIYSNILINTDIMQNDFEATHPYYSGIAKVLAAINLSYATDVWGDVPFLEAFGGLEGNFQPGYDEQEVIYEQLQILLDDAITLFDMPSSSNQLLPGSDDFMYKGDVSKWKNSAYVLKARYALRLGNLDDAASFIASSNFTSSEDDLEAVFGEAGNERNQWAAFQSERSGYLKMGEFFIDLLKSTEDPRLPFYATLDNEGGYSGNSSGDTTTNTTSDIGAFIASNSKNIGMVTYVEAKFIEAEALLVSNPIEAKAAFVAAVEASVLKVTEDSIDPTFVTEVTATVDLENIITQKYVAMFSSMEPYNDFRRTGFPELTPNPNADIDVIPVRLLVPQDQRINNPNAVIVPNLVTPVWWDNN